MTLAHIQLPTVIRTYRTMHVSNIINNIVYVVTDTACRVCLKICPKGSQAKEIQDNGRTVCRCVDICKVNTMYIL